MELILHILHFLLQAENERNIKKYKKLQKSNVKSEEGRFQGRKADSKNKKKVNKLDKKKKKMAKKLSKSNKSV